MGTEGLLPSWSSKEGQLLRHQIECAAAGNKGDQHAGKQNPLLSAPGRRPSLTNNASGDDTNGDDDSNGGANSTGSSDGANGIDNNGDDTSMLVTYQKIRLK